MADDANAAATPQPESDKQADTEWRGMIAPGWRANVLALVVALLLALVTYVTTVWWSYLRVFDAYRHVNVFEESLATESLVPVDAMTYESDSNDGKAQLSFNHRLLFHMLQQMGFKSPEDDPAALATLLRREQPATADGASPTEVASAATASSANGSSPDTGAAEAAASATSPSKGPTVGSDDPFAPLFEALVGGNSSDECDALQLVSPSAHADERTSGLSTSEVVAYLMDPHAGQQNRNAVLYRQMTADIIAALLANQPTVLSRVDTLLRDARKGGAGPIAVGSLRKVLSSVGDQMPLRRGFVIFPTRPPSDETILKTLYDQFGLGARYNALYHLVPPGEVLTWDQRLALDDFMAALLSRMHASHQVRDATAWISRFQGPEQLAMWFVLWWMLLLMLVRLFRRLELARVVKCLRFRVQEMSHSGFSTITRTNDSTGLAEARAQCASGIAAKIASELRDPRITALRRWLTNTERGAPRRRHGDRSAVAARRLAGRTYWLVTRPARRFQHGHRLAAHRLVQVCIRELEHNSAAPSTSPLIRACRDVRAHDERSRWIIMWLATALPAIGFIGTVRGISAALSTADSIVRAQDTAAQAAAITDVAGVLGIAFTTTLMALLMGLLSSFLSRRQSVAEQAVIDGLQSALEPLLEHSLVQSSQERVDRKRRGGWRRFFHSVRRTLERIGQHDKRT